MFYKTTDDLFAHQHPQAPAGLHGSGRTSAVIEAGAAHGLYVMVNYETTSYSSNRAAYYMVQ